MLSVQVESFQKFIDDALEEILEEHWKDLALNQDRVPLDPQFSVYREREKNGELLIMSMRSDDELAGYFVGFIAPGLHYQTCLTCTMDIFFVRPKFRDNLMAGRRLFKAVEAELSGLLADARVPELEVLEGVVDHRATTGPAPGPCRGTP